jgi:ribosomal protein S18 acetylase RimI-like enzyme
VLKSDPWLGDLLGCPSFNVAALDDFHALRAVLPPSPALVTVKVPAAATAVSMRLQELGFRVIDAALTFECDRVEPGDLKASVRFARPDDRGAVEKIARTALRYTRFHLDPMIPNDTASALKAAWAANFFNGRRGDEMIVAELDGVVVGFLLAMLKNGCFTIDLIAVDPSAERRGVASAMIRFAAQSAERPAPSRFRVGTQAANTPSCRLYEHLGFRFSEANFVLHHHGVPQ